MDYKLLKETGHSFSGISNIIYNEPEKTRELLLQIDKRFNELKKKQEELKEELKSIQNLKGYLVSDFVHFHLAMKLNEKPISFVDDGYFTEIKILSHDEMRINYEKKKITYNPVTIVNKEEK